MLKAKESAKTANERTIKALQLELDIKTARILRLKTLFSKQVELIRTVKGEIHCEVKLLQGVFSLYTSQLRGQVSMISLDCLKLNKDLNENSYSNKD